MLARIHLDVARDRPRQPINGVIVAISIADLLGLEAAEVYAHAEAIRKRLAELHEQMKISFPVYVVLTKMDLIAPGSPSISPIWTKE